MKIRDQLRLVALSPLLVAIILAITLYVGGSSIEQQRQTAIMADHLGESLEQFEFASIDYFINRSSRALSQAGEHSEHVVQNLEEIKLYFDDLRSTEILEEVGVRFAQADWALKEFLNMQVIDMNEVQRDYMLELSHRFNTEMSSIKPLIRDIHGNAHLQITETTKNVVIVVISVMLLVVILVLIALSPIFYRIDSSMKLLTQATKNIAREGELNHSIEIKGKDEFAQLAIDFNLMSYKLSRAEQSRQKHLDELEMAVKDLEAFSYSVSHDLRSPLRAIDGFISILKEDYGKSLDEEGLRLFGIVQENANKMGELIDDILAFSRAGRFELQKDKVNMRQLVSEVWDDIQLENPEAEIQMQIDDIPDINADVNAMRQVLHNLLSNAVKFTRKTENPKIQVGSEKLEDSIRYFVKDNGVGFNKEYKEKLFVMFQRLHGMDEFEGTGVGLAIVKRFIQKHNGSVDADAIVDKGATFNFILPVEPASSGKERGND